MYVFIPVGNKFVSSYEETRLSFKLKNIVHVWSHEHAEAAIFTEAVQLYLDLSGSRSGDDGRVDDVVVSLSWWRPAGSVAQVLSAQRGVVNHLLRHRRTRQHLVL